MRTVRSEGWGNPDSLPALDRMFVQIGMPGSGGVAQMATYDVVPIHVLHVLKMHFQGWAPLSHSDMGLHTLWLLFKSLNVHQVQQGSF